ncbi:MAG: stage III sporulation protein AA [Lachnospiraceae bacterium]|nr:stage III sporulation protein AA [Lachnospiraceae bacterium]
MESVYRLLAPSVRGLLEKCHLDFECLQEIRLRVGRPVMLRLSGREMTLCENGCLSGKAQDGYCISAEEIKETLEYATGFSLYAFDEEVRQGFLTVPGGHRIGLAGHAVTERTPIDTAGKHAADEKLIVSGRDSIRSIRHISFLNIRLAHERKGCADELLPYLYEDGEVCHTLIVSPPGGGKTTLLRDVIRQISDGNRYGAGRTVGVVDERSELAGSYLGVPQNDLGLRTDVLDGCGKSEGMLLLLRSMSPQVLAADELGNQEDALAVEHVFTCGCKLIATVHGSSPEEVDRKPLLCRMKRNHMFERFVVLSGREDPGRVREIQDGDGKLLYRCSCQAAHLL